MNLFSVSNLIDCAVYSYSKIMGICSMQIVDSSDIPEAMTPDMSDMVSILDVGQSSMTAHYGDDSGDQCSLGRYLYTLYKRLNCAAEWSNYMFSVASCLKRKQSKPAIVDKPHISGFSYWISWCFVFCFCKINITSQNKLNNIFDQMTTQRK